MHKKLFFLRESTERRITRIFKKNRIAVKEIIVYQTNEIPVKVDEKYNGILFFSPSAVKSFFL